jgi:predicted SAM-dependent methyltransferase
MSHVIEHVHDPVGVLKSCFELLRPGGVLWLETPNICSFGHETFGRNWRGLEPPRHLVIFSPASMRGALEVAGFSTVEIQRYRRLCREIFAASNAISRGVDPYSSDRPGVSARLIRNAESVARSDSERREFITLKAWK